MWFVATQTVQLNIEHSNKLITLSASTTFSSSTLHGRCQSSISSVTKLMIVINLIRNTYFTNRIKVMYHSKTYLKLLSNLTSEDIISLLEGNINLCLSAASRRLPSSPSSCRRSNPTSLNSPPLAKSSCSTRSKIRYRVRNHSISKSTTAVEQI